MLAFGKPDFDDTPQYEKKTNVLMSSIIENIKII